MAVVLILFAVALLTIWIARAERFMRALRPIRLRVQRRRFRRSR